MGNWYKLSFCCLPCEWGPVSFPALLHCILTFCRYCWWGAFHLCCTLEFIFSISAHKHILFLAILEHPPQTSSAFITVMFLQTTASYFRPFFFCTPWQFCCLLFFSWKCSHRVDFFSPSSDTQWTKSCLFFFALLPWLHWHGALMWYCLLRGAPVFQRDTTVMDTEWNDDV